jgi:hypothetical protein
MISTNSNCNDKKKGCITTSSECVVWQGPNISCINLCTGDTISTVVATLAEELCALIDSVNVTGNITCIIDWAAENDYDLSLYFTNQQLADITSGEAPLQLHFDLIYNMICKALECCDKEDRPPHDTHSNPVSQANLPTRETGVAELTDKEYEDLIAQGAEIEILTGGSV